MNFEWRHGQYKNPRLYYLYHGNYCLGMVSMLGNTDHIRGYSVYLNKAESRLALASNEFQCVMPTLDEAKMVLQTLAGAQL